MESKKLTEKILQYINKNEIEVYFESGTNCVLKKCKFGSYLLEFYVHYSTKETVISSNDYDVTDDFDIKNKATNVSEISIYINNELQELTDDEYEKIHDTLYWKIVHES
tara:strand:+ start:228 stop:554 length:327 start_codon:yes stop_codon:yes gene_type:complete